MFYLQVSMKDEVGWVPYMLCGDDACELKLACRDIDVSTPVTKHSSNYTKRSNLQIYLNLQSTKKLRSVCENG